MFKTLSILILFMCCSTASARMYQWVDPESGTTQLSGKPPAWYRSDREGPRVFVFENGKVIDDTGRQVDAGRKEILRQQALLKAEENREAAKEELLDAKRLKATLDQNKKLQGGQEQIVMEEPEPAPSSDEEDNPEQDKTIERMQTLIRQWEQLQTENARQLVESSNSEQD